MPKPDSHEVANEAPSPIRALTSFAQNPAVTAVIGKMLLGDATREELFGSPHKAMLFMRQLLTSFGVSETSAKIIYGAVSVFAEHGVAETNVEQILQEAGVSRRTFYKHFSSRDQVVEALFLTVDAIMTGVVEASWEQGSDPVDNLRNNIRAFVNGFAIAGHLLRPLFVEALRPGTRLQRVYSERLDAHVMAAKAQMDRVAGADVSPKLVRSLLLAVQVTVIDAEISPQTPKEGVRAIEGVLRRVVEAALLAHGPTIPSLP